MGGALENIDCGHVGSEKVLVDKEVVLQCDQK